MKIRLLSIFLILSACQNSPSKVSLFHTLTPTELSDRVTPLDVTATAESTKAPTPFPTLTSDERERQILDLISSNGGCQLPCWWGITPGKTTLSEARNFFRQFNPYPSLQGEPSHTQYLEYLIPVPENISQAYSIDVQLEIVVGVVHIISVQSIDSDTEFGIQNILSEYGQPSEVWIHTYRSYLGGIPPVDVLLFYPEQGILTRYSTELSDVNEGRDSASICLNHSPSLTLWPPDEEIDFDQAQDYARLDYKEFSKPLLPLEQATSLGLEEFYDYRLKEQICLTTTLSLWPEP